MVIQYRCYWNRWIVNCNKKTVQSSVVGWNRSFADLSVQTREQCGNTANWTLFIVTIRLCIQKNNQYNTRRHVVRPKIKLLKYSTSHIFPYLTSIVIRMFIIYIFIYVYLWGMCAYLFIIWRWDTEMHFITGISRQCQLI